MRTSRRLFWGRGIAGLESPAPAGITEILRILRTTARAGPMPASDWNGHRLSEVESRRLARIPFIH